jgi:hypothetical protein
MTILGPNPRTSISSGRAFGPSIGYPSDVGPCFQRVNSSEPPKGQDDQINYFDHLDHLRETKDLAANMTKPIHNRQAESSAAGYYWTNRNPHRTGQTVVIAK